MVVDSSDTDRLHIAKRELHQMVESEVREIGQFVKYNRF